MTGFEAHHREKARTAKLKLLAAVKRGVRRAELAARTEAERAQARLAREGYDAERARYLAEGWNLP